MRKIFFLGIVIIGISSCYRLIPKKYYKTYNKIISSETSQNTTISRSYIDTWYYSDPLGRIDTNHTIYCLYKNNLCARIILPRKLTSGKWLGTIDEYNAALIGGQLDPTHDFSWNYYKLEGTHLTSYDVFVNSPAHYILNIMKFEKSSARLLDQFMLSEQSFLKMKKDSLGVIAKAAILNKAILKPDSSLSEFYCSYQRFKATGYRRDYGFGVKKYKNPCGK